MRILLCSNWFAPSFGGVETTSKIFAEEFSRAGHQVTVVTESAGEPMDVPYEIVRKPSGATVRGLARGSDILFQNLISLKTLVHLLPSRKPVVVTHASWMRRHDGSLGPENVLKRMATRLVTNVSISESMARSLPVKSILIDNPFEAHEFLHLRERPRTRDLVFMGRLVSDKGCVYLVEALGLLKERGLRPTLTIIGDGPERPALERQAETLGLKEQVTFAGAMREGRGEVVAQHRIMVIPSRWVEPFGVVALEGIASGCAIVASEQGGLPDAAGPCGVYFPNRDSAALADRLAAVLTDAALERRLVEAGPAHIERFRPEKVGAAYLALFESLLRK